MPLESVVYSSWDWKVTIRPSQENLWKFVGFQTLLGGRLVNFGERDDGTPSMWYSFEESTNIPMSINHSSTSGTPQHTKVIHSASIHWRGVVCQPLSRHLGPFPKLHLCEGGVRGPTIETKMVVWEAQRCIWPGLPLRELQDSEDHNIYTYETAAK